VHGAPQTDLPHGVQADNHDRPPQPSREEEEVRDLAPRGERVLEQGTDGDLERPPLEEVQDNGDASCQEWGINYEGWKQYLPHDQPVHRLSCPTDPLSRPQRGPPEERTKPFIDNGAGSPGPGSGEPRENAGDHGPRPGRRPADPSGHAIGGFQGVSRRGQLSLRARRHRRTIAAPLPK
jgi:hypothetical protein